MSLALVLMTVAAYQPVWHAGFIWDDERHVTDNRQVAAPDGFKQIWFSRESIQYYPMVFTTFRVERALWGLNPAPYHWLNLLLHAGSALLLWRVLRHLRLPGAWLGAALFALHPVNVESVAWISQRKNTLAMVFYLLSILWFLKSEAGSQAPAVPGSRFSGRLLAASPRLAYGLAVLAFVLALLSKTAVAPLPVVLLGLAWWQRGRVTARDVWRCTPFFLASLALGLVSLWFEREQAAWQLVREASFWSRLAGAGWAVWFYLYKALLPWHLAPMYPLWRVDAAKVWSYVPGLLVVAGFLLCWRYRRGWGRAGLACAGYYLVMLLPVLGFVDIGFMNQSLVADHWQYFAIIGLLALAAGGMGSRLNAPGWRLAAALLVLVLGVLTWRQAGLYADPEALWRATLAVNPGGWGAHNNLGEALAEKGQTDEAIRHYQETIRLNPPCADAHNNLGIALGRKGQVDEAIRCYQEAIRLEPTHVNAHNNLANALVRKGRPDAAIPLYEEALRLDPHDANAHYNLGIVLGMKGETDEAVRRYQEALRLRPGFAAAHYNLGRALASQGRVDEAIRHYQEALRLKPDYAEARKTLDAALAGKADAHRPPGVSVKP